MGRRSSKNTIPILSNAAALECAPCYGLSGEAKRHFKRLVGEALSYNFEDDYQTAEQMLKEARTYIQVRSEEMSRRWYLSASAVMTAIMMVLGLLIWIFRASITSALTENIIWLSLAAVAGSCGALLSVIWRSGQLKFDCSAGASYIILKAHHGYGRARFPAYLSRLQ